MRLWPLGLVACGPDAIAPPDDSVVVELGHGWDAFDPLDEGETTWLERGPQGFQHIYVGLRAPVEPGYHEVGLTLLDIDGSVASSPYRLSVPFAPIDDGRSEVFGLVLVIPEPSRVLTDPSLLDVTLATSDGVQGAESVALQVAWTP